jgi:hypothetical protein
VSLRACILSVIVLLVSVTPAHAAIRPERPPLPRSMPKIVYGHCPGLETAGGCYLGNTIYVLDRHSRFSIYHELGHAFDEQMMDAGERNRFAHLVGMADLKWTWADDMDGALVQAPGTPAERFADAYAACRMGLIAGAGHIWKSGYGYYPRARQHRLICGVIARAGGSLGSSVSANGDR